ncbi:unnamed protein product, partial [Polarella glacialis]
NCGGRRFTSKELISHAYGSLRELLEALLRDQSCLEEHVQAVFAKASHGSHRLERIQLATGLQELVAVFGVRLDVNEGTLAELCKKYSRTEDGGILFPEFMSLCRVVLQDRYVLWFPEILPVSTANFVRQNDRHLEEVYKMGTKLGEGSFGIVYRVEHRLSGEQRVCKKIAKSKSDMTSDQILQEIGHMAMLDHPNVIKVYEYFDDPAFVSQIMEPCNGGELQDKVDEFRKSGKAPYDEAFVCDVVKQTLRALAFMHNKPFLHKDLKPQNIMMVDKASSSIKVIDFGLAEMFNPHQKFAATIGGTLLYMAPEVFRQKMTVKIDVWSTGVILYNLLTGDFPFLAQWPPPKGRDEAWWQEQTIEKIKSEPPTKHSRLGKWSAPCLDLLIQMLQKDDKLRPDATQCLDHPWFRGYSEVAPTLSVGVVQCVEAYARMPELRKGIFLLLAHQYEVQAQALLELRALFTHFDVRNQGSLSATDLKAVLIESGMGPLTAERVYHALDRGKQGQINWTEFTAAAIWFSVCRNDRAIDAAFGTFDTDQDGRITAEDLCLVLADDRGHDAWQRRLPALFDELADSPGPVSRPSRRGLPGFFSRVFMKEAAKGGTLEQFRQYVKQKLDFRAGDVLYAVT